MAEIQDLGHEIRGLTTDLNYQGGYRHTVGIWREQNVAANQTATAMELGAEGADNASYPCIRAGSITGIGCALSVAAAGSALTILVYKGGSVVTNCTLTVPTDATAAVTTFAKDLFTFAAGNVLDVRFTTDGSWTATTSDADVWLEIET